MRGLWLQSFWVDSLAPSLVRLVGVFASNLNPQHITTIDSYKVNVRATLTLRGLSLQSLWVDSLAPSLVRLVGVFASHLNPQRVTTFHSYKVNVRVTLTLQDNFIHLGIEPHTGAGSAINIDTAGRRPCLCVNCGRFLREQFILSFALLVPLCFFLEGDSHRSQLLNPVNSGLFLAFLLRSRISTAVVCTVMCVSRCVALKSITLYVSSYQSILLFVKPTFKLILFTSSSRSIFFCDHACSLGCVATSNPSKPQLLQRS